MKAFESKAKIDIPLKNVTVKEGDKVTITEISNKYYLWHPDGIYLLDESYITDDRKIISEE